MGNLLDSLVGLQVLKYVHEPIHVGMQPMWLSVGSAPQSAAQSMTRWSMTNFKTAAHINIPGRADAADSVP